MYTNYHYGTGQMLESRCGADFHTFSKEVGGEGGVLDGITWLSTALLPDTLTLHASVSQAFFMKFPG